MAGMARPTAIGRAMTQPKSIKKTLRYLRRVCGPSLPRRLCSRNVGFALASFDLQLADVAIGERNVISQEDWRLTICASKVPAQMVQSKSEHSARFPRTLVETRYKRRERQGATSCGDLERGKSISVSVANSTSQTALGFNFRASFSMFLIIPILVLLTELLPMAHSGFRPPLSTGATALGD